MLHYKQVTTVCAFQYITFEVASRAVQCFEGGAGKQFWCHWPAVKPQKESYTVAAAAARLPFAAASSFMILLNSPILIHIPVAVDNVNKCL